MAAPSPAQERERERYALEGMSRGDQLRAWSALSLEEKREHLKRIRLFRRAIYELSVYQGMSINEIAAKYNVSHTYINFQLSRHVAKLAKKHEFNIPAERLDQYHRLKMLMEATYKRALDGDDFAVKSYVALAARFAKVIGLDAPTKFQHEVNKKTSISVTHTVDIEDLERRIALVKERKKLLAMKNGVAAPISDQDLQEKTPVLNQSFKNSDFGADIGHIGDPDDVIDIEAIKPPEQFNYGGPTKLKGPPDPGFIPTVEDPDA